MKKNRCLFEDSEFLGKIFTNLIIRLLLVGNPVLVKSGKAFLCQLSCHSIVCLLCKFLVATHVTVRSAANTIVKVTSVDKPLRWCSTWVLLRTSFVCRDPHVQGLWELELHGMMRIRTMFTKSRDGLVLRGGPARWNKFRTSILQWAHNCLEQLSEVLLLIFFVTIIGLEALSYLFLKLRFGIFKLCLSFFESVFSPLAFFFSLDNEAEHFPALVVKSPEGSLANIFGEDDLLFRVMLQFVLNFFTCLVENTNEAWTHLLVCFVHFMEL